MKFWFAKETATSGDGQAKSATEKSAASAVAAPAAPAVDPVASASTAAGEIPKASPIPAPASVVEQKPTPAPVASPTSMAAPKIGRASAQVNQRDLYCNLMNALYDAILVLDDKGHVVDSNERVMAIFGYSQDDMWDRPASDVVRGFGPQLLAKLAGPLSEHRPVIIDGTCQRRDGTVFQAEIAVGGVRLARGENIVLSIRDVGKRLAAALERMRNQQPAAGGLKKPAVVRLAAHKSEAQGV